MAHNTQRANDHFLEPLLEDLGEIVRLVRIYTEWICTRRIKGLHTVCQRQSNDGNIANLKDKAKVPACI
jgi:hypothetical protein